MLLGTHNTFNTFLNEQNMSNELHTKSTYAEPLYNILLNSEEIILVKGKGYTVDIYGSCKADTTSRDTVINIAMIGIYANIKNSKKTDGVLSIDEIKAKLENINQLDRVSIEAVRAEIINNVIDENQFKKYIKTLKFKIKDYISETNNTITEITLADIFKSDSIKGRSKSKSSFTTLQQENAQLDAIRHYVEGLDGKFNTDGMTKKWKKTMDDLPHLFVTEIKNQINGFDVMKHKWEYLHSSDDKIKKIWQIAKKLNKKFSRYVIWNPADVWIIRLNKYNTIMDRLLAQKTIEGFNAELSNMLMIDNFIFPISLKQFSGRKHTLEIENAPKSKYIKYIITPGKSHIYFDFNTSSKPKGSPFEFVLVADKLAAQVRSNTKDGNTNKIEWASSTHTSARIGKSIIDEVRDIFKSNGIGEYNNTIEIKTLKDWETIGQLKFRKNWDIIEKSPLKIQLFSSKKNIEDREDVIDYITEIYKSGKTIKEIGSKLLAMDFAAQLSNISNKKILTTIVTDIIRSAKKIGGIYPPFIKTY